MENKSLAGPCCPELQLELAQAKKIIEANRAIVDMINNQAQVKGYPTASEWMKLVSCAREAAKKVQDILEGKV